MMYYHISYFQFHTLARICSNYIRFDCTLNFAKIEGICFKAIQCLRLENVKLQSAMESDVIQARPGKHIDLKIRYSKDIIWGLSRCDWIKFLMYYVEAMSLKETYNVIIVIYDWESIYFRNLMIKLRSTHCYYSKSQISNL